MRENLPYPFVECNDQGAEYIEARVSCNQSQVTDNPTVDLLNLLLPFKPYGKNSQSQSQSQSQEEEVLLSVQYNMFDCGGVAVGVCVTHKIADGSSAIAFVNAWAALSRGTSDDENITSSTPTFDCALHFPPRDLLGYKRNIGVLKEKIVTKRFVFDKSSIRSLQELASSPSQLNSPTRVEAISALIWRSVIAINLSKPNPAKICAAVHAVNLRDRMVPPLPSQSFGNYWRPVFVPPEIQGENKEPGSILVRQLRNSISEINEEFVKKLKDGNAHTNALNRLSKVFDNGEMEVCNFTSWVRFPVYEVDFGWGKPSWVCSPNRPYKNLVVLMSSKDGCGIEAWVNMLEEDMAKFERHPDLLPFLSSSPTM